MNKKVMYITASTPWGKGETFIIEEIRALKELGHEVLIVPRSPEKDVFNEKAKELTDDSIPLPLISPGILFVFAFSLLTNLAVWKVLKDIIVHSRTIKMAIKNLSVVPKGVFIYRICGNRNIGFIHAHWGSTPATLAYVIAKLSGIPWGMTLHRWDIAENNMLQQKVASACFTRCIADDGKRELIELIGDGYNDKIKIIYMGVWMPEETWVPSELQVEKPVVIACPANLIEKKGHRYLIEACKILNERKVNDFQCLLMGDGPLQESLQQQVKEYGLAGKVLFKGRVPHNEIISMYRNQEVDIVALPSIITDDMEREGIPVSLMEAMGYGIPVISTNTGGIGELIADGTGFLVDQKNEVQLADCLELLINERNKRRLVGAAGRVWVSEHFNIVKNAQKIVNSFQQGSRLAG
ncbi:glycosyltransferase [Paenibacillus flagellatus]|uniref:Colanic acid biosynthesis glycosyltransferase WcaL n=1 Tax=Paenibacillus flagellatus TaxID=2211139 RepID=A0A2V5KC74_9BACL|nr:glycosyltransferase [Paenibacillus flagellatus]PYI57195.1 colanic acid biosynthesis glycosyltransferase WcaL [Paenibacillus flagellatus]